MVGDLKATKSIVRRFLFIVLYILLTGYSTGNTQQDVQILDSDNYGLTIQITPVIDVIDTIVVDGEKYLKIIHRNSTLMGEQGAPMVPVRVINVGIPPEVETEVRVLSTALTEIQGKLLPVPNIDQEGRYFYRESSPSYQSSAFYPESLFSTEKPTFFRNQKTLTIKVNTIQVSSLLNKVRVYNKIILRISFKGNTNTGSGYFV